MSDKLTINAYELAKEKYLQIGVDVEVALRKLDEKPFSIQCWQGDDVTGFEKKSTGLTGGIQATGSYPGRARTPDELREDIGFALSLIPGTNKVNLHACYLDTKETPDRDGIEPIHFALWVDWAVDKGIGLDFNPTFFSHPKSESYTLASSDLSVRGFWVEHAKRCRKIGEYFGKKTGKRCITNIWIPDGAKEFPPDSYTPRSLLMESLDEILKDKIDAKYHADTIEGKLFGIGAESYTVGSNDFYLAYAVKNKLMLTADTGHYHLTESVADKLSVYMLFLDEALLHVSRGVRWDSDHVVSMDESLSAVMKEIIRGGFEDRIHIALDYFDASINRVAALVIGARNSKKAYLRALLEPKTFKHTCDVTPALALEEEYKSYPWGAVWDYYCLTKDMPVGIDWLELVKTDEKRKIAERG